MIGLQPPYTGVVREGEGFRADAGIDSGSGSTAASFDRRLPIAGHGYAPELDVASECSAVPDPGAEKEDNSADLLTMEEILLAKTWKLLLSCSHRPPCRGRSPFSRL